MARRVTRAQIYAAADKYHVPRGIFYAMISAESGGRVDARSSAGAYGPAQLMPATAKGLGVNPRDPLQNLEGGAKYLSLQFKQFGTWRQALAAYNAGPGRARDGSWLDIPETRNYVSKILGEAGSNRTPSVPDSTSTEPNLPAPPDFSAAAAGAFQSLGETALYKHADPVKQLSNMAFALASSPPPQQDMSAQTPTPGRPYSQGTSPGKVRLAGGADRAGVHTSRAVLDFVGQVAGVYGKPLTITTGTNHNEFVVGTHRESQHWQGHAADIAASGAALTRLGRAALVAAGMDPRKAAKVNGGVFNIGRYQILFNTRVGGNHYNHLHVGVR